MLSGSLRESVPRCRVASPLDTSSSVPPARQVAPGCYVAVGLAGLGLPLERLRLLGVVYVRLKLLRERAHRAREEALPGFLVGRCAGRQSFEPLSARDPVANEIVDLVTGSNPAPATRKGPQMWVFPREGAVS
jgi:hypothetical protein